MPPRKRSGASRKKDGDNGSGDTPQLGRNPDADPVRIHRDYVERRIGGGAAPTSDAYGRALEEFHKLPGAVRQPAAEATGDTVRERSAPSAAPETSAAPERSAAPAAEDVAHEDESGDDTGGAWEPGR
ncbi:hypothetical protein ACQPZX_13190 [Actinoplanes sp. CA-142083]|uniref:hypothetical protein n=1 Tax=Actinoplanes sp. CA-142083 TaxID=3239903 RepID=UPI003D8DFCDF